MSAAKRTRRTTTAGGLDETRGVFMISVAAELAEMHPQTLRMYEARGLITPAALAQEHAPLLHEDVERLRRIQRDDRRGAQPGRRRDRARAGGTVERMRAELGRMRKRAAELERQMLDEVERVRRAGRAEIVPYGAYEPRDARQRRLTRRLTPAPVPRLAAHAADEPVGDPAQGLGPVLVRSAARRSARRPRGARRRGVSSAA